MAPLGEEEREPLAGAESGTAGGAGAEVGGMYTEMDRVRQKKREVAKEFLREWLFFCIFVAVYVWSSSMNISSFAQPLVDQLTTFLATDPYSRNRQYYTVKNLPDYYDWLESKFLPNLRPTEWYDGMAVAPADLPYTSIHNYLVGTFRIRQVRVRSGATCDVPSAFASAITDCFPTFSPQTESREAYGPPADPAAPNVSQAFVWQSEDDLCRTAAIPEYCRRLTLGYPASGFTWDFATDYDTAAAELEALKTQRWVDEHTRFLIVELTLYDPNVELVAGVQFLTEIYPTGTWRVYISIKPMPTFELASPTAIIQFSAEILLVLFVAIYLVRELAEFWEFYKVPRHLCPCCQIRRVLTGQTIRRNIVCIECEREYNAFRLPECPCCGRETQAETHVCWRGYFADTWNWLDLANQACFLYVFGSRFLFRAYMGQVNLQRGAAFVEFHALAWAYAFTNWLNAGNALLCFAKIFKYLGKFKALSALVRTLARGRQDLASFAVLFLTAWAGFAFAFHLAFGADVRHCQDWSAAMMLTFLAMLGDFDYDELFQSQKVLAPILFTSFMIMFSFIFLNVFIAIVSEAFELAKEDIRTGKEDFMGSSLALQFNELAFALHLRHGSDLLPEMRTLVHRLQSAGLKPEQLDDLRAFTNEVEHDPFATELFSAVLTAFTGKVDRPMAAEDFQRLRLAVVHHRQRQLQQQEGDEVTELWAEDGHGEADDPERFEEEEAASVVSGRRPSEQPPLPGRHRSGSQMPLSARSHGQPWSPAAHPRHRRPLALNVDGTPKPNARQQRWRQAMQLVMLTPHQRQFHAHLRRCEEAIEDVGQVFSDICKSLSTDVNPSQSADPWEDMVSEASYCPSTA